MLRGEESTWEQIPYCQNLLKIEIKLDELLQELKQQLFTNAKDAVSTIKHPLQQRQISYSNPNLMFYASNK